MELCSRVWKLLGEHDRSLKLYKYLRNSCTLFSKYQYKLEVYEQLVSYQIFLQNTKKALAFATKLLKLSWKLRNQDSELKSYDLIGKIMYYKENYELAHYFHKRSLEDSLEPANSAIRENAEKNLKLNQKHL